MSKPKPVDIVLHRASHVLEVAFDDGERFRLPCEYLRVESPSAEVQGHGPGQRVLVPGKRKVNISQIEPIGFFVWPGVSEWTRLRSSQLKRSELPTHMIPAMT